jgi:hypothetical protein
MSIFATRFLQRGTYQGLDLDGREGDFFPAGISKADGQQTGAWTYSAMTESDEEGRVGAAIVLCGRMGRR